MKTIFPCLPTVIAKSFKIVYSDRKDFSSYVSEEAVSRVH